MMNRRKNSKGETCPVARSLAIVGDRWSLLILRNAFDGMRRFSEFQRDLGLSKSVLAARLQSLVGNGILRVEPGADESAYKEYGLTEKGRGLFYAMVGFRQWGETFLFGPREEHSIMVERASGKAVRPLELHSQRRTLLTPEDVMVQKV